MTSEQNVVLIVDDREANRYATAHALRRAGYKVIEASSGREALELSRTLPTVIVLDVKLPDIVGYEVCRRIKANAQTRHIPVLQLSVAFLNNESKLYALESGADAYLIQPADPMVLVATVKSLVRLHQAEAKAHLAARQWQSTFDALNEGVAIIDTAGIVQRCNRAMTTLLRKPYGEIEGCAFKALVAESFHISMDQAGAHTSIEVKAGSRFFRLSLDPITANGEVTGNILIIAETTRQKVAEEALLITERLAATGRMAHTIAHEINNPLEAITNLLYLLQSSNEIPEIPRQHVNLAAKELARVSRISRQILSFNRESSKPIDIQLNEIIEDALALNNRGLVEKSIGIVRDWTQPLSICGFPAQLRQVFSNLVRNAIEASCVGGQILIRISACGMGPLLQESAVRVTIADRGIGIPIENRKRIFDAFFTTKDLKGSGIGLWLSSSLIQEHGGWLRMRSSTKPGHSGTCVSVVLPKRPMKEQG